MNASNSIRNWCKSFYSTFFWPSRHSFNQVASVSWYFFLFILVVQRIRYAYRICIFKNTLIYTRPNCLNRAWGFEFVCHSIPIDICSATSSVTADASEPTNERTNERKEWSKMLKFNASDKKRNSANCRQISKCTALGLCRGWQTYWQSTRRHVFRINLLNAIVNCVLYLVQQLHAHRASPNIWCSNTFLLSASWLFFRLIAIGAELRQR